MPRTYVSHPRTISVVLAAMLVVGNALARGGVSLATVSVSCGAAAVCLALAPRNGSRTRKRIAIPVLAVGLGVAVLVIGLQLVPLPPAMLRLLSPRTAATFTDVLAPLGLYPAWRPVSLAPGTTAFELAKAGLLFAAVLIGAILGASDRRRDQLLRVIALSGVATVGIYYGFALAGKPPPLNAQVTFVNPNHLAGFLQLAAWPALGFALRTRGLSKAGWLLAFALTSSGIFLSLSRGGIVAFFVAVVIFAILRVNGAAPQTRVPRTNWGPSTPGDPQSLLSPGDEVPRGKMTPERIARCASGAPTRPIRSRTAAILGITGALAIVAWLALDPVLQEMDSVRDEHTTALKLELWPLAVRMIRDFPLVGIGRGAFATSFPAYKWEPLQKTFTHVENEWLQLPLELGLVSGVGILVLFAWAFLAAARRRDVSRPLASALAGAGALMAHNVFDFSLEVPGVAIPFAIVLGIASRYMPKVHVERWVVHALAIAVLLVAATGLFIHRSHTADGLASAAITAETADNTISRARDALLWHPADYLPPTAAGVRLAFDGRCKEATPWLIRAMTRNPTAPEPHRGLAHCLARSGQAALAKREYRLAFSYGDRTALDEAHGFYPQPGALLDVAPDTPEGLWAAGMILRDDPAQAAQVWQRAWDSFKEPRALIQLARARLALGALEDALALARSLELLAAQDPAGYVIAASALDALGRGDDAQRELDLGAARLPGNFDILAALGVKHLSNRRFSQARATFLSIVVQEGPLLGRKRLLIARALEAQGRYREAFAEAQVARGLLPNDLSVLVVFARIAREIGFYDEAIGALEIASTQPGTKPGTFDASLAHIRGEQQEARIRNSARGVRDRTLGK